MGIIGKAVDISINFILAKLFGTNIHYFLASNGQVFEFREPIMDGPWKITSLSYLYLDCQAEFKKPLSPYHINYKLNDFSFTNRKIELLLEGPFDTRACSYDKCADYIEDRIRIARNEKAKADFEKVKADFEKAKAERIVELKQAFEKSEGELNYAESLDVEILITLNEKKIIQQCNRPKCKGCKFGWICPKYWSDYVKSDDYRWHEHRFCHKKDFFKILYTDGSYICNLSDDEYDKRMNRIIELKQAFEKSGYSQNQATSSDMDTLLFITELKIIQQCRRSKCNKCKLGWICLKYMAE